MKKDRLKQQIDFLIEVDKLKNVFRQSFITSNDRNENDAEHSWHMAMFITILEEYAPEDTNILKVIKMALIHDLVEIYAGDTFLYSDTSNDEKLLKETESAEKIFSILPDDQKQEFLSLWEEFEEKNTNESKFCATIDRVQPILLNYLTEGGTWKKYNVCKSQVLDKGFAIFEYANPEIKNYILEIIEDSVKKGYLINK